MDFISNEAYQYYNQNDGFRIIKITFQSNWLLTGHVRFTVPSRIVILRDYINSTHRAEKRWFLYSANTFELLDIFICCAYYWLSDFLINTKYTKLYEPNISHGNDAYKFFIERNIFQFNGKRIVTYALNLSNVHSMTILKYFIAML